VLVLLLLLLLAAVLGLDLPHDMLEPRALDSHGVTSLPG
jgi:hypothetical protein